jgi:hypothetical protein
MDFDMVHELTPDQSWDLMFEEGADVLEYSCR